ncbi:MAG: hypothetical protein ACMXYC_04435 [Candidatus Woesearchaeota archaeon]
MSKGRPTGSRIRQGIVDILFFLGEGYGYIIHKLYVEAYGHVTREVVYYHLKKGIALGEIVQTAVRMEKGNFSWGGMVEKTYYGVGPQAVPTMDEQAKKVVESFKKP